MEKFIKIMSLVFVACLGMSFASCSSDDDISGGSNNYLMINGDKYVVQKDLAGSSSWYGNGGDITFYLIEDDTQTGCSFNFNCDEPKEGVVLNNLRFANFLDKYYGLSYKQISGTAKIKSINKKKETITVQFDNVKMKDGPDEITLNGTPTFWFDFDYDY